MPGPTPKRPSKTRPINPMDSAGTTGLPVNPNGTYVANPFPTTAQNGSQGQFGAMLPQVNVGGLPNAGFSQTPSMLLANVHTAPATPVAPLLPSDVMRMQNPPSGAPQVIRPKINEGRGDPAMQAIRDQTTAARNDVGNFFANYAETKQVNYDLLPESMNITVANQAGLTAADMAEMGYKVINGKWVQQNSTQAQTQAQTQANQQANAGNTDFMQTGFMQENAANNVSFSNQLRWDPSTGTYQKIGKLVQQGKLDLKTGKDIQKKKNKGGGQQAQKTPQPQAQVIGSVTGNFNTAGG